MQLWVKSGSRSNYENDENEKKKYTTNVFLVWHEKIHMTVGVIFTPAFSINFAVSRDMPVHNMQSEGIFQYKICSQ